MAQAPQVKKNIIIIDGNAANSPLYHQVFEKLGNIQHVMRVIQTPWTNLQCTGTPYEFTLSFTKEPLLNVSNSAEEKNIFKKIENYSDHEPVAPSLVIVREPIRRLPQYDCANILYGLMMSNIKMVNSSASIIKFLERPLAFGALNQVAKRIPNFPRLYFSCWKNSNCLFF